MFCLLCLSIYENQLVVLTWKRKAKEWGERRVSGQTYLYPVANWVTADDFDVVNNIIYVFQA